MPRGAGVADGACIRKVSAGLLARFLARYAVEYVTFTSEHPLPQVYAGLLQIVATPPEVIVTRVARPTSLLAEGPGQVRASTNRIDVGGSASQALRRASLPLS